VGDLAGAWELGSDRPVDAELSQLVGAGCVEFADVTAWMTSLRCPVRLSTVSVIDKGLSISVEVRRYASGVSVKDREVLELSTITSPLTEGNIVDISVTVMAIDPAQLLMVRRPSICSVQGPRSSGSNRYPSSGY